MYLYMQRRIDDKRYINIQANAGDSRSVISVKGEVKPLSFDHKPSSESELSCFYPHAHKLTLQLQPRGLE